MNESFQLSRKISAHDLSQILIGDYCVLGSMGDHHFDNISNLQNANDCSLVFLKKSPSEVEACFHEIPAKIILLDLSMHERMLRFLGGRQIDKLLIFCRSPRTNFSRILEKYVVSQRQSHQSNRGSIHPTAIVSPLADIGAGVTVGPHSVIGHARIGAGSTIGAHVIIEDGVALGCHVLIESACVIGSVGYAEITDETDSNRTFFPQLGGVSIADHVRVGVGSVIQRGTMQDTIIGEGSVIDNKVVIAHNVELGRNVIIIGSSHIAGSVRIGDGVFIGQSVTVANVGSIGANAFIGMGSVVTRPIKEKERVFGNPAKPILAPTPSSSPQ
jgi:UDP-3-O-[3-hydroxymyristoyl] glucosamine N-acyltransferase